MSEQICINYLPKSVTCNASGGKQSRMSLVHMKRGTLAGMPWTLKKFFRSARALSVCSRPLHLARKLFQSPATCSAVLIRPSPHSSAFSVVLWPVSS